MNEINYGLNTDNPVTKIADLVPERLIKVYPYEFINADNSKSFIQENSVSIAAVSQDNLDTNNELLLTDDDGYKYFEMFAAITSEGQLDISSATSVFGQELKEEDSFTGISNWYYEGELESIKIGSLRFLPAMFVIGERFNRSKYEENNQAVFIPNTMTEAQEGRAQNLLEIDPEGLYEFQLINLTSFEASFTNARVIPIENSFINQFPTTKTGNNGISIAFEHQTLINSIKAKGKSTEADGKTVNNDFNDIEFISQEKMAPFKMTPISTQDKITMYADWFDYDNVMPFVFANMFKGQNDLSGIIGNDDDRHMVEDMLVVSDGFASSWAKAPRDTSGDNAGKIKPDFRIGWSAIKVQAIEGKNPIEVVDGIYEEHLRKYPQFFDEKERYQPVREVLNALSRFLYTSYAIGKGQNSYNELYLPWFLYPSEILKPVEESVNNPDYGATGKVKSFVLNKPKFKSYSVYFRKEFSNDTKIEKNNDLLLPENINLSNIKLLQTDRKLTLPELPDIVNSINKLPLPGDIDTQSSQDLSYIFYLPIQSQSVFEKLMIDSTTTTTSTTPVGTDIKVLIPDKTGRGVDGKVWTQNEADSQVLKQQPGTIKQAPTITQVESATKTFDVTIGRNSPTYDEKWIQNKFGYEDLSSIKDWKITSLGGSKYRISWKVTYSEFGEAIVTITSSNTQRKISFTEGREVIFDKEQWQSFLTDFNIFPSGYTTYNLNHKKTIQHSSTADYKIAKLDEIIISSVWGNNCILYTGTAPNENIVIPLFNQDDETIGVQRILFT